MSVEQVDELKIRRCVDCRHVGWKLNHDAGQFEKSDYKCLARNIDSMTGASLPSYCSELNKDGKCSHFEPLNNEG